MGTIYRSRSPQHSKMLELSSSSEDSTESGTSTINLPQRTRGRSFARRQGSRVATSLMKRAPAISSIAATSGAPAKGPPRKTYLRTQRNVLGGTPEGEPSQPVKQTAKQPIRRSYKRAPPISVATKASGDPVRKAPQPTKQPARSSYKRSPARIISRNIAGVPEEETYQSAKQTAKQTTRRSYKRAPPISVAKQRGVTRVESPSEQPTKQPTRRSYRRAPPISIAKQQGVTRVESPSEEPTKRSYTRARGRTLAKLDEKDISKLDDTIDTSDESESIQIRGILRTKEGQAEGGKKKRVSFGLQPAVRKFKKDKQLIELSDTSSDDSSGSDVLEEDISGSDSGGILDGSDTSDTADDGASDAGGILDDGTSDTTDDGASDAGDILDDGTSDTTDDGASDAGDILDDGTSGDNILSGEDGVNDDWEGDLSKEDSTMDDAEEDIPIRIPKPKGHSPRKGHQLSKRADIEEPEDDILGDLLYEGTEHVGEISYDHKMTKFIRDMEKKQDEMNIIMNSKREWAWLENIGGIIGSRAVDEQYLDISRVKPEDLVEEQILGKTPALIFQTEEEDQRKRLEILRNVDEEKLQSGNSSKGNRLYRVPELKAMLDGLGILKGMKNKKKEELVNALKNELETYREKL